LGDDELLHLSAADLAGRLGVDSNDENVKKCSRSVSPNQDTRSSQAGIRLRRSVAAAAKPNHRAV